MANAACGRTRIGWKHCVIAAFSSGGYVSAINTFGYGKTFPISSGSLVAMSRKLIVILCCIFGVGLSHQNGDENCETLPFQLHLIKGSIEFNCCIFESNVLSKYSHFISEEYDELGRLQVCLVKC